MLVFTRGDTRDAEEDTLAAIERDEHRAFLKKEGYERVDGALPQPSEIKEMRVYRKDFGLAGSV